VNGRENITGQGPFLIVCNHLHLGDPPIVAASVKIKAVFMAKEELFQDRWSRFWVGNFGAFPVRRGGINADSIKRAESWVKQGASVIMFPEGTRSKTTQMQKAFPGPVLIASRLGTPILPISITGTEKFRKPAGWFSRPKVTVTIGKPFNLPSTDGKLSKEEIYRLSDFIMVKIAELLPEKYRGVYGKEEIHEDRKSQ
jgi:1-acyl-sn-glycerol-3-phosphate acyltransferase